MRVIILYVCTDCKSNMFRNLYKEKVYYSGAKHTCLCISSNSTALHCTLFTKLLVYNDVGIEFSFEFGRTTGSRRRY